jgi:oligoendopeptidase F
MDLAKGIKWNLSDLYASPDDPGIGKDLKLALEKVSAFEKAYKQPFEDLSKNSPHIPWGDFFKDLKDIVTCLTRPAVYAFLYFAENTSEASRGAFLQKIRTQATEIETRLLFWSIAWKKVSPDAAQKIMGEPELAEYRHYLENFRKLAPFTLSELEERILTLKSNTSDSAFVRLFDETVNRIPFYLSEKGKKVQKTETEVLALLHSPSQTVRQQASLSLAEGLHTQTPLLTYIYNMILADHRLDLKLRGFGHAMDPRNLDNETDQKTIQNLILAVKNTYPLVARYYRLKKRLLGLDKMHDYDRYAPLAKEEEKIPFAECERLVLAGYTEFSTEAGRIAKEFFSKHWIDAEIRPGKQGGGFCCQTTPELHPYVLVNYTGSLRDVMTVAHELGHGIHQYLSSQVGVLESHAPLTMAETASVFGEMLIFEKIIEKEKDPTKRLQLICGKIDDNFATVYRQIAMTDFEMMAHEMSGQQGELSEGDLNGLWLKANADMYGDSVILTDAYQHGWKYIPHFVHSPFYCYAYAFAQLFVLSLFQKYKENKKDFVPGYHKMLSLGGSKRPEEIAAISGLDIQAPGFWKSGLGLLEDLVSQAEELTKTSGLSSISQ